MKKLIAYFWASLFLTSCQINDQNPNTMRPNASASRSQSNTQLNPKVTPGSVSASSALVSRPSSSPSGQSSQTLTSFGTLTDGLTVHYAFEGNIQSHNRLYDGSIEGQIEFLDGIKGKAASYTSAPIFKTNINFPSQPKVTLEKNFTVSVWSLLYDEVTARNTSLPILCTQGDNQPRIGLFWTPGGPDVFLNKGATDEFWLHREKNPRLELQKPNRWNHSVISYDGQQVRIYLNGQLEVNKPYSEVSARKSALGILGWCPEVLEDHETLRSISFSGGQIDELRIYSRALSNEEVQRLYDFDRGNSMYPHDEPLPRPKPQASASPSPHGSPKPKTSPTPDVS